MKRKFIWGLILSILLSTSVFAETEKRVDGKRVETYKRVTVDTIRGHATNGIGIDTNRDGTNEIGLSAAGALTADGLVTGKAGLYSGVAGTDGIITIFSEQGTPDYLATINPNAAMTSNANFYLPADEAGAESFLKMGTDGVIDYDTNLYATTTLNNLGTTAINASLLPGVAGAVNLGSEALFFGTANIGTALVFEGATDDEFQTTIGVVDPTTPDKTINFPNASGTVAVSATTPITLSALGDVGLTLAKDIVASGTGMSGGADDVLPGADADVTITLTTLKDIVAGTGLSGGENDVLPGADADTTISLDLAAANVWTGAHSFQVASPQITLGKDETGGTPNIPGQIKLFSNADDAYYTTITAAANASNAAFILPTDEPAATYILNMTSAGQIGYDTSVYLTAEVDGSVSNEINTLTLPDANVTAGLGITFAQAGSMAITESAPDTVTFTVTETDPLSATKALGNLASVAINESLVSDTANTDDLGTEALYWKKLYLASDISFEGATDDAYQTTLTAVDVTDSDKSINIPNASGVMAVSATAPATLSALGDIGVTVAKDIVTTAPLAGGADDVLPGADSDLTLSIDNISYALLANGTDGNLITWGADGAPALVATGDVTQVLTSAGAGAPPAFAAIPTLNQNTTGTAKNLTTGQHLKFTIIDPATTYTKSATICVWNKTDAAIHIKNIEFRCNADPATEVTGDIKYADDLIGLGNPTLIAAIDTTAGTFSSGAIDVAVASGKCIYLSYDTNPDADTTQHAVDINWSYD